VCADTPPEAGKLIATAKTELRGDYNLAKIARGFRPTDFLSFLCQAVRKGG
jgi:hypothetical protein